MVNLSKSNTSNVNQSKYGNKVPYNNVPPSADEELAPILVTAGIKKDPALIKDNIETWNIHGHKIPVAFAPVKIGTLDNWMKFFWSQVRTYIATGGTDEFLKENGHNEDLSYDKFLDDAESDENVQGFDPGKTESLEDSTLMYMIIDDLIKEVTDLNPKYGRILQLLYEGNTKGEILKILSLGKSQGYADISSAQKLAKELYDKN